MKMMHYLDGIQEYSLAKAKAKIKRNVPVKERKYFYVVKEKYNDWQTGKSVTLYVIRISDYSKIKIIPNY